NRTGSPMGSSCPSSQPCSSGASVISQLVGRLKDVRLAGVELSLYALDDVVPRGGHHSAFQRVDDESYLSIGGANERDPDASFGPIDDRLGREAGAVESACLDDDGLLAVLTWFG